MSEKPFAINKCPYRANAVSHVEITADFEEQYGKEYPCGACNGEHVRTLLFVEFADRQPMV